MSDSLVLKSLEDGILTLTVNRPDALNALNRQVIDALAAAIEAAQDQDDVRVLVLTGSGAKAFVAGADIKEFADFDRAQGEDLARRGQRNLFDRVEQSRKPVVAAINGFALGGGLELAMAAHVRIASGNARMGLPEVSLGVIPGYGGNIPGVQAKNMFGKTMYKASGEALATLRAAENADGASDSARVPALGAENADARDLGRGPAIEKVRGKTDAAAKAKAKAKARRRAGAVDALVREMTEK